LRTEQQQSGYQQRSWFDVAGGAPGAIAADRSLPDYLTLSRAFAYR
jgi:hypothetical protein